MIPKIPTSIFCLFYILLPKYFKTGINLLLMWLLEIFGVDAFFVDDSFLLQLLTLCVRTVF